LTNLSEFSLIPSWAAPHCAAKRDKFNG
jgi:hypothetical protein